MCFERRRPLCRRWLPATAAWYALTVCKVPPASELLAVSSPASSGASRPQGSTKGTLRGRRWRPSATSSSWPRPTGLRRFVAAASHARLVLLASLLNLEAVLQVLAEAAGLQLQIVCAGTNEAPALEDTYLAGRICAALPGERTDAALIAEAVARSYETPFEALAASADARALSAAGLAADTAHCALESRLQVVPRVLSASDGTAMVGPQNTVQADLLATAMPSSQRLLSDRTRQTR